MKSETAKQLLDVVERVYEYELERMEEDDHHFHERELNYWKSLIAQARKENA